MCGKLKDMEKEQIEKIKEEGRREMNIDKMSLGIFLTQEYELLEKVGLLKDRLKFVRGRIKSLRSSLGLS